MKLKATEVVEAVLHNLIHCVESTPLIIGSPAIGKTALSYSVLQLYADYLKLKVIRGVRGIPEHNITPKKKPRITDTCKKEHCSIIYLLIQTVRAYFCAMRFLKQALHCRTSLGN